MDHVTWKVELHSHTRYSKDCLISPETFIRTCERRGLDRVAVTDHNTAAGGLALSRLAPALVIVGEEIMTTKGELLAYFIRETVPPNLTPEETIWRLRDQGAVITVSHPFDRLRKGAWQEADLLEIVEQVDAIEIFNARCLFGADNRRAGAFAAAHAKPGTVGSDAHTPFEIGRATLRMQPFEGAGDFLAALGTAVPDNRLSPAWVHGSSTYAKWLRKLRLSRMPDSARD